jgi:drug/metabolite transporter (DMT)-like permease
MAQERRPLDATALSVMLLLSALWGFHQVAVKWIADDVSLVMQAGIRSVIATALLCAWARARGVALFDRDGTLGAGIVAGLLFAAEFVFIFAGLGHTTVSRMSVFVYLTPALTALGLHFFVRAERLRAVQWGGVLLGFAGIVVAFSEGFASDRDTMLGDVCGIVGAVFWSAVIVVIRTSKLGQAEPAKTLFYQLGVSALALPIASLALGEAGVSAVTPQVIASLAYQSAIIAFGTYLAWFWLLRRYLAARLSVLSFMTPIFGVVSGVVFLNEPFSMTLGAAAALVGAGIVLVNLGR